MGTAQSTKLNNVNLVGQSHQREGISAPDGCWNSYRTFASNTVIYTETNQSWIPNQRIIRHVTVTNDLGNMDSQNASNYTACLPLHKPLTATSPSQTELDLTITTNRGGASYIILQRAASSNGPWTTRYSNVLLSTPSKTICVPESCIYVIGPKGVACRFESLSQQNLRQDGLTAS